MIKDPKQIVTPFAFSVHQDLLGLPLASPKRRLAAFLLDLLIASVLSSLGTFLLATAVTIIFFWIAVRTKGNIWWRNLIRYGAASFASIFVFALAFGLLGGGDDLDNATVNINQNGKTIASPGMSSIDWTKLTKESLSVDYSDPEKAEEYWQDFAEELNTQFGTIGNKDEESLPPELFENETIGTIRSLASAIQRNDSSAIDTLREALAPLIASVEINTLDNRVSDLRSENNKLSEKNDQLEEEVNNPSFLRTLKATAEDFGLTIGWIGVYFVISLALFRGHTLGKKLLGLKVIRLNNKPIGIWYSFERFGGYAAGIATGLLGFAQIYWDANRQAVHDKIAGTVVIDTREKKMKKFEHLRKELLETETSDNE